MRNKKSSFGKVLFLVIFLGILGGVGFVFVSPIFEKEAPTITFKKDIYWNLKESLDLKIDDNSGIKYYKVVFKDGTNETILKNEVLKEPLKTVDLKIVPPQLDIFFKSKEVQISVEVVDNSKWNFLEGNQASETFNVKIDTKKPVANVVGNSLAIRKGGSAVAVVEVFDDNLEEAYISFNNDEETFELIPFYKENYYVSLIAWPVTIDDFEQVSIIAKDKAGNIAKNKVPLYIRPLKAKNDNIKISDNFIKNVSTSVLEQSNEAIPQELEEVFIAQNRLLRAKNVDIIKKDSRKYMDKGAITSFDIKPFSRLNGSRTAAGFAEKRHYYHNGSKIDEAWHLGIDWASVKHATIKATNPGRVIASKYIGIYGNTIIVDHKMGLSSLYAHTSIAKINVGDEINANQVIAKTGTSGAVLGDHLHFGVLVQGIEVNPLEWMDKNWIKTRITDVLDSAKKVIDTK